MDSKAIIDIINAHTYNDNSNAFLYSFTNIISLSLLSDCGIKYKLDSEIIGEFLNTLQKTIDLNDLEDNELKFLDILKPTMAVYSSTITNINDNDNKNCQNPSITINNTGVDKLITSKSQALLILNELNLSTNIYLKSILNTSKESSVEEKLLSLILIHSSVQQTNFMINNLKNSDGFFLDKVYLHNNEDGFTFDQSPTVLSYEAQGYVALALITLYRVLISDKFKDFFPEEHPLYYLDAASELLEAICEGEDLITSLDTHEITGIVSSMLKALSQYSFKNNFRYISLSLTEELYSRVSNNGYVFHDRDRNNAASLSTHFRTIEALYKAYSYNQLDILSEAADKIFLNIDNLWDDETGIYIINKKNGIKYTSKTIAHVLKALLDLFLNSDSQEKKENYRYKLEKFFNSVVSSTGLQPTPPCSFQNSLLREDKASKSLLDIIENSKDCIMFKGFKLYHKRNKLILNKKINSEYSLLVSDAMLYMNKARD